MERPNIWVTRIKTIALGGGARIISSLSNVIISFIIIRIYSASLWGEFVSYLLILDFGFSFVSWGSTPFLIREFSLHPNKIRIDWGGSFYSRSLLLGVLVLTLLFTPITFYIKIWLIAWSCLRFVYQSFEPIAQTERHFIFTFFVELVSIGIIVIPVLSLKNINLSTLLILFTFGMAFKATAFLLLYRKYIGKPAIQLKFFKHAFPFLLLTFSAMLQQRIDLYSVAYFLSNSDLATYQVFLNFLIFSQFTASLLLSPYSKNIFRLNKLSFLKLERSFILAGLWFSALSVLAIFICIQNFYHFSLSWKMYLMGYGYILMFYVYLLRNYELGKLYKQTKAAVFSFLAGIVTLIGSLFLTPRFGLEGALFAGLLAQLFLAFLYHQKYILTNAKS